MIANDLMDGDYLHLHEKLLHLRHAELLLAERYKQQEMRTPTHFGVGQEATAVGVCHALRKDDVAYSHHRSHNHYLAKGGSLYRLAAELLGRETGCSKGRGGSVHLTARECGFIASSAILGQAMTMATGSALSFKMDGCDRVSVAFFGDAVAEEGAFYESLSYAALKQLPVLYVCENNGYATESNLSLRQPAGIGILSRVQSFGISGAQVNGNDVEAVFHAAQAAVDHIRVGKGPYFLECETYRWLEHVGPYYDADLGRGYRSAEEVAEWKEKCPVKLSEERLIERNIADRPQLDELERGVVSAVIAKVDAAYNDPWPKPKNLFENAD